MSPTAQPTATSDNTRSDVGEQGENMNAQGADVFADAREGPRPNALGIHDDLRFDEADRESVQLHSQLQLIRQLQSELAAVRTQLDARRLSMSDTSMATAPPTPKKPKIKDVRCPNFKGNEVYPGLGAGFENFIHEFEHAVRTEGLVNGSTWTDEFKASVIVNFLEGNASRHYHKKNAEWRQRHEGEDMPYSEVKRALRTEFGCKLSQLELSTKMKCFKREGDSWHDFLEYLNFIESLMEGDQTKLVMEVFGNNACPELAPTLLSSISDEGADYVAETDRMKRLLYKLKGDGRKSGVQRKNRHGDRNKLHGTRNHERNNRPNDHNGERSQANSGENAARSTSQQQNGQAYATTGNRGEIRCHVCGKLGHKIFSCPVVEQAKRMASSGNANIAAASEGSEDGEDSKHDSDAEAHVWMAAKDIKQSEHDGTWTVDSGATHHLCNDRSQLFAMEPAYLSVRVANGNLVPATERGSTVITVMAKGVKRTILLENVYFAKDIDHNLISVGQLSKKGISCTFGENEKCIIRGKTGKVLAEVGQSPINNLWSIGIEQGAASFAAMTSSTLQQWHERLGHVNYQDLVRMLDKKLVQGMIATNRKVNFCMNCAEAKQARRAKNTHDTSTSAPTDEPGATLCVDLKTDMTPDRLGHKHILTIVDHATNFNRVYLLFKKSDAEGNIEDFISEFERQYDTKVKVLRSDGGGEFGSTRLDRFLLNRGIRHQSTEAGMSSSNGKAERFHRTVMDSARAMLWASTLPQRFWGDAVLYASYIRNHLPTRSNADHASPIEALSGKTPNISHILRFGAKCTSHVAHAAKKSTKKRAEKGIVIGVDTQKKAYKVFIPRTKRIVSTTHIQNIDRIDARAVGRYMDAVDKEQNSSETAADIDEQANADKHDEQTEVNDVQHEDAEGNLELSARAIQRIFGLNRGARPLPNDDFTLPQSFIDEFSTPVSALLTVSPQGGTALSTLLESKNIKEPTTVKEARRSPQWREWEKAMQEELRAIAENATWEIVDTPSDGNLITAKWVFKLKFDNKGELERFKARLVARGFNQKYGVDFGETFAPVLKIASLRLIVALAALWHAVIRQGDVPNAYLRAALDRAIYMQAPEGLELPEGKSLRLLKSLYGLKQSGKLWNNEIHNYLLELGFERSKLDPCLYFRRCDGKLTVLGLYVDDVIIVSQRSSDTDWTMKMLSNQFQIKDMGEAKKCLGICIEQTESGIFLQQAANIDQLLAKLGMENCRPVTTPMESTRALQTEDSEPFFNTDVMRETIGSLLWLSTCTRPDITMSVNYLARFVSSPTTAHWTAIKRVLRYLRGSRGLKLAFMRPQGPQQHVKAAIFSDADWAGDKDAKSTSGGLLVMNDMPISWYSKKQSTVALSTAEAEYIAGATAVQDCLWVKQLLEELSLGESDMVILNIDNQSAIKNMENDVTTARMKHINIKFHFIRDAIRNKDIEVHYCPTTEMRADILTKPLGVTLHGRNVAMLKLVI